MLWPLKYQRTVGYPSTSWASCTTSTKAEVVQSVRFACHTVSRFTAKVIAASFIET